MGRAAHVCGSAFAREAEKTMSVPELGSGTGVGRDFCGAFDFRIVTRTI